MKIIKSPGHDKITNEHIKFGGEKLISKLINLFNKILDTEIISTNWKKSDVIFIHKKGDRHKIANYSPNSISAVMSKIFPKLIETRYELTWITNNPENKKIFAEIFPLLITFTQ